MIKDLADIFIDFAPARYIWKPLVKRYILGSNAPFVFKPGKAVLPDGLESLGLYLHVPFCRQPCPYCPYNRVKYDNDRYRLFETAAHHEIDLYGQLMSGHAFFKEHGRPRINSFYVGGGTPTIQPRSLAGLIAHVRETFGVPENTCVECHPAHMDDECLDILKSVGVTMVSIGVQSLSDRLLELIGRAQNSTMAMDAVRRAIAAGFQTVNADLMFALPTQTVEDFDHDVTSLLNMGVDQISAYPIFGFPYTKLGKKLGIKSILRPPGGTIKKMLSIIRSRSIEKGFRQCSVWSYARPDRTKFSSTTRQYYIGIGPSAASMTGDQFYINTFSVEEYASSLPARLPVALVMQMDKRYEMAFWLYWRIYEMELPSADFKTRFNLELKEVYGLLLDLWVRMGMMHYRNGSYCVTDRGAYWIHRIQNEYALNYIDRLWGICRSQPWPQEIRL
jgi:coproporphyrinogen III oxidase-like Fe-S oxidoreductase